MNQIKVIIGIGKYYSYFSCVDRDEDPLQEDETGNYHIRCNDKYTEHYKVCSDAATEFINLSESFSDLTTEEIICAFANLEFKEGKVLRRNTKFYEYGMLMSHSDYRDHRMALFEELLKTNKEMLVALIKAIYAKEMSYDTSYYFIGYDNKLVGKRQDAADNYMIILYHKLLKHGHFNVDHLNLSDEVKNIIRPTKTKKAI